MKEKEFNASVVTVALPVESKELYFCCLFFPLLMLFICQSPSEKKLLGRKWSGDGLWHVERENMI